VDGCTETGVRKASKEETAGSFAPALVGPAHTAATADFSIQDPGCRFAADSPLEGTGFELLVRGRAKLVVGRRRRRKSNGSTTPLSVGIGGLRSARTPHQGRRGKHIVVLDRWGEGRMGRAARPLYDAGNHSSIERGSDLQAACRGRLRTPAEPAGERANHPAFTPRPGARSSV